MILKRRLFFSLTFILIFSLVGLIGCTDTAQEKPIEEIEKELDMNNGIDDNAYNYGNKSNRLYGFFGAGNTNRNPRMDNGISNPNMDIGTNDYGVNNYTNNENYGLGVNPTNQNMPNVLTGSQSNLVRKFENNCNQVGGVNDTTIVKKGNTCYVGLDLNAAGSDANISDVKSQCSNKIKNLDPSIKNVVFTTDENQKSKLETMIRNVNIGRPATGFMNELEDLFR